MKEEYNFKDAKRGQVVQQKGKTRITIYPDPDILEALRCLADEAGYGYQTMINETLRKYLEKKEKPLDESVLRQVIREELERISRHENSPNFFRPTLTRVSRVILAAQRNCRNTRF